MFTFGGWIMRYVSFVRIQIVCCVVPRSSPNLSKILINCQNDAEIAKKQKISANRSLNLFFLESLHFVTLSIQNDDLKVNGWERLFN